MKKYFFAVVLLSFWRFISSAQTAESFSLGPAYYLNGYGAIFHAEINFSEYFSFGPVGAYSQRSYGPFHATDHYGNAYAYTQYGMKISGGVRAEIHPFTYFSEHLDPYVAVSAGYCSEKYTYSYTPPPPVTILPGYDRPFGGADVGMNIFFSDHFGLFLEGGVGSGLIKGGMTFKFY